MHQKEKKKKMKKGYLKKLISAALLSCLLISTLSSCKKENTDPPDDQTSDTSADTTIVETAELFDLIVGGESSVTIVRPDSSCEDFVFDAFGNVRSAIKKQTGITVETAYECLGKGQIIVGSSGNEILDELSESYRLKDYFVGVYKGNLVVFGYTTTMLKRAVEEFSRILEEKSAQSKTDIKFSSLENSESIGNYKVNSFKIANNSLQKYCLVYSESGRYSEELIALKLKDKLESNVGFPISVYTDKKAPKDAKKILIGKTNYSDSIASEEYEFTLDVKNGDLRIYSDSTEGYTSAFSYFVSSILSAKNVSIDEGFTATKSVDTSKITEKINKTGDIRIMLSNIFGNCDNTKYPISYRTRSIAEVIAGYSPDVVGLQECSPMSRSCNIVDILNSYGFSEVKVTPTNSKNNNYTPLFYNPNTVKVIDSGYVYYNGSLNDSGSKSITWAVFETLSTSKRFAVCSTHFFYQSADLGGDTGRVENAKVLVSTAKMIADKYNVPVIAGGDLNTTIATDAFKTLTRNGFSNIQGLAKVKDEDRTFHAKPEFSSDVGFYSTFSLPDPNAYTTKAIDHALVYNKGDLSFKLFRVIKDSLALMSSDHCPIMMDFDFSK